MEPSAQGSKPFRGSTSPRQWLLDFESLAANCQNRTAIKWSKTQYSLKEHSEIWFITN